MSNTASGRRRASTPVAEARPRDAHRRERAERIASQAAAPTVAPVAASVPEFRAPAALIPSCATAPPSRREARNGSAASATSLSFVPSSPAGMRPRDARRTERRRRAVTVRRDVSFAGMSQKVAIAAAASGMVLTVALPTTAAVVPSEAVQTVAAPEKEELQPVQAAAGAEVSFDRAALHSRFDPDAKLAEIVSASGGDIVTAVAKGSLAAPLDNAVMTSPFGTRVSPITGAGELHTGQDMSEACGTAVKAAAAGTVTFAGWHAYGGGNRVVVEHANGLETTYNHLSAMDVAVGQTVERGEAIGRVGSTGASTGCHLHFEVLVDGKNVDPLGWL